MSTSNIETNNLTTSVNDFFKSLNLMKVIACFAVILIHSSIFDYNNINNQWWAVNFYNAISRFAVPMFIMISGALLINEKHSLKHFLSKRAIRIIPALIFWSVVYLAWLGDQRIYSASVINAIISGPVYYHLWYLYAMIGVLMFSPILSAMYHNSNDALKSYFLTIWILSYSIYPMIKELLGLQFDFIGVYELYSFFGLVGWYFLGAFVRDYITKQDCDIRTTTCLFIFFISVIAIALLTYVYSKKLNVITNNVGITSPLFFERNSPLIMIGTISLFIFLSQIKIKENTFIYNSIKNIASFSLGIYCLHLLLLRELLATITNYFDNRWISIPVLSIVVFTLCVAIIYPLRKVKIVRYVL